MLVAFIPPLFSVTSISWCQVMTPKTKRNDKSMKKVRSKANSRGVVWDLFVFFSKSFSGDFLGFLQKSTVLGWIGKFGIVSVRSPSMICQKPQDTPTMQKNKPKCVQTCKCSRLSNSLVFKFERKFNAIILPVFVKSIEHA